MTRNSKRRNNLTTHLENNSFSQDDFITKPMIKMTTTTANNTTSNMTPTKQKNNIQEFGKKPLDKETLERGRRKRFRYFVASLGLTVAAANCYAQATFCIAIVEMVLPADYVFKGESGSLAAVRVVPAGNNETTATLSAPPPVAAAIEDLENLSCPVEYKYKDYYDEWRFPNASSSSPLADLLTGAKSPTTSSHVIDISNRFDWDASRQGLLLGAFAMGMAPLQVLGGRLAEIYGAKWVLLAGCIGTALTNLTIPVLAHFSYTLLVVNRVFMGIAQAGMEPGLMCLMAQWLAPAETGFFISMLLFALCIGFFLGSLLSSFLLTVGLGWALTYYVTGGLNLIMSIVWLVYASKGPQESKLISGEELAYIMHEQQVERTKSSSTTVNNDLEKKNIHKDDISSQQCNCCYHHDRERVEDDQSGGRAPWMNILTTPSVWAFIICKISVRWCADVLTIELPTYLANVLHLSIKLNGILNSLSSAFFAIFSFITGYFVNELLKRTHDANTSETTPTTTNGQPKTTLMSKTTLRKLFQSVASFGSAISIFLMTHYDCNIQLSMSMMFVLSACLMMGTGGELQIPYDMTSRYPGTLHGMACTLSVSGWLAPPLIGLILGDQPSSRHRWSLVWYLTASINFIGGLVFVLFADASPRNFDQRRPAAAAASGKKFAPCKLHPQNNSSGSSPCSVVVVVGATNNGHQHPKAASAAATCNSNHLNLNLNLNLTHAAGSSANQSAARLDCFTSPRPSTTTSTTFDCGELLRIRQLEGSLLSSPSGQLDSMLADQLMMFPYKQQPAAEQTKNGLTDGLLPGWLVSSFSGGGGSSAARRRQRRRQRQTLMDSNSSAQQQLERGASKIITRL